MAGILSKNRRTGVNSSFCDLSHIQMLALPIQSFKSNVPFYSTNTKRSPPPFTPDIHLSSMVEPFGESNVSTAPLSNPVALLSIGRCMNVNRVLSF